MRLRKTNPGDLPQLKALWALGFGDTEQEIEAFFAISYPTVAGFCAEEDGRLIAAAYALPQELAWGEKKLPLGLSVCRDYAPGLPAARDLREAAGIRGKGAEKAVFRLPDARPGDGRAARVL